MTDVWTKQYPDTAIGAYTFLKAVVADDVLPEEFLGSKADPWVAGVWKLAFKAHESMRVFIVYLAGYEGPGGQLRLENDYEMLDD